MCLLQRIKHRLFLERAWLAWKGWEEAPNRKPLLLGPGHCHGGSAHAAPGDKHLRERGRNAKGAHVCTLRLASAKCRHAEKHMQANSATYFWGLIAYRNWPIVTRMKSEEQEKIFFLKGEHNILNKKPKLF